MLKLEDPSGGFRYFSYGAPYSIAEGASPCLMSLNLSGESIISFVP